MQNSEQHVLITGGTSGIGFELAKLFAKDGYSLVIAARGQEGLDNAATELKKSYAPDVVTIAKDLSKPGSAQELCDEIKAKGITIDILVNDAGQGLYGEFVNTDLNRELDIIQLNIGSLVIITKHFLKEMVARKSGRILNLSSVASKIPGPLQSVYHGTKAFVQSFTEAIREEVKGSNVSITALLPGATGTDFFNKAGMLEAKNVKEGKLADPAEVAKDGYEALMKGDDMVVSGFKNKVQVAMSNILPDHVVAQNVHKQQAPVEQEQE